MTLLVERANFTKTLNYLQPVVLTTCCLVTSVRSAVGLSGYVSISPTPSLRACIYSALLKYFWFVCTHYFFSLPSFHEIHFTLCFAHFLFLLFDSYQIRFITCRSCRAFSCRVHARSLFLYIFYSSYCSRCERAIFFTDSWGGGGIDFVDNQGIKEIR